MRRRVALVEHPMGPWALAAPLHRHTREDGYSYVLEGRVGALLGDEVVVGGPGDLIFKPRGQWHTFWNAGALHGCALRVADRRRGQQVQLRGAAERARDERREHGQAGRGHPAPNAAPRGKLARAPRRCRMADLYGGR